MRRTLFMHIPKTAGTSVLAYMREAYAGLSQQELRTPDNTLGNVTPEDIEEAQFIWLHEPLYELPYDTSGFFRYTILRDPVERIRSHFRYMSDPAEVAKQDLSNVPESYAKALRRIQDMSFEEFILSEDPHHTVHTSNSYSKYFRSRDIDEEDIEICLKNLDENFHYVGFTDTLGEDINRIRSICFPEYGEEFEDLKFNVSRIQDRHDGLSDKAAAALAQKVALDTEIYEYAKNKKQKMLADENRNLFARVVRKVFGS